MKEKIVSFCWQHLLLLLSLFVMTVGVAVCVRSMLGSSVISVLPYVFASAGGESLAPALTIGQYTYVMNFVLVVGFLFGSLIDINMQLTAWLAPAGFWQQALAQAAGCTILGIGIALEVRCGSITMPGEGFPVAISRVTGIDFPKVKIGVDILLVALGAAACYLFFGAWQWHIIGIGTLFAMFYVGAVVRLAGRYLGWFDRLLAYRPGFRRYIYGLARFIYNRKA